jgi:TonB-linked SusC/RagA family outer membrane protein
MLSMINYFRKYIILIAVVLFILEGRGFAQDTISGQVIESGSGKPLHQVVVSSASTGQAVQTDEKGRFSLSVPDLTSPVSVYFPGYTRRRLHPAGADELVIYLVREVFVSYDDIVSLPLQGKTSREIVEPFSSTHGRIYSKMPATPTDGLMQGTLPGLNVIRHSGFPGHKAWLNIGGVSSIYAKQQPLLIIDGMIHEYNYADQSVISGFSYNPWDIIDAEDIADITVLKGSLSSWGSNGSNGIIYLNTEKRSETSSEIAFSSYGGVGLMPDRISMLNSDQFRSLYTEQLLAAGQDPSAFPWLQGVNTDADYYRYNNNTDWQSELFRPSALQKYHIFLKGGDDIATYNISTGFLKHGSVYENAAYSRYNLRVNGNINITDKFSVVPNVKLSLSDSYLASMGSDDYKNPVTSSLLQSPLMAPMARDPLTGIELNQLDDVGVFNVSNPLAIVKEGFGNNRNYHFVSSIDFRYQISPKLVVSSLTGIGYNNARENIFLPDHGLVNQEFADNSRHDLVYDFRSTQNHSRLAYTSGLGNGLLEATMGLRYLKNGYKFNIGNDLNTASDDFRNLGQGAKYQYLRTTQGDDRELIWASLYGVINYSINDKYYVSANFSRDGNSNINKNNRYNNYPSLGLAWRVSSEPLFSFIQKAGDLKLRTSYGISGNMHSFAYDYSKLFYVGRRLGRNSVLVRDAVPNNDLTIERKSTFNAGLDFTFKNMRSDIAFNYYHSNINNLLINQQLPAFGFENYFDNGGTLNINAFELAYNGRTQLSQVSWSYGLSVSRYVALVKDLRFLDERKSEIIHDVSQIKDVRVQYITRPNSGLNLFYGYKTDGHFTSDAEASQITGPGGIGMHAGDIRYVDKNNDNVINSLDMDIIGDPNPDLFGGMYSSVMFRNIEISAFFTYSYGNDIFNYVRFKTEGMSQFHNQSAETINRWNSSNSGTDLPRASFGDPTGNTVFSDRWIEDGSYLRLKNLIVSYQIPFTSRLYREATVYLTASNLFTITGYKGFDPEVYYENSAFQMGIDYGKIPHVRSFILGVKLSL